MKKHERINEIIKETNSNSYLEIGYGDGFNFERIECEYKLAVDPELKKGDDYFKGTSDDFFDDNDLDFDIVFIDGYHTAEQARKDITNALRCNPKAVIIHDTIPQSEEMQKVPRSQKQWTGDVWRSAVGFIENYPDVKVETNRSDFGLTVIYPEGKRVRKHFENTDLSWDYFQKKAKELLNIID